MNRKTLSSAFLIIFGATVAFAASPRQIAYERSTAKIRKLLVKHARTPSASLGTP